MPLKAKATVQTSCQHGPGLAHLTQPPTDSPGLEKDTQRHGQMQSQTGTFLMKRLRTGDTGEHSLTQAPAGRCGIFLPFPQPTRGSRSSNLIPHR